MDDAINTALAALIVALLNAGTTELRYWLLRRKGKVSVAAAEVTSPEPPSLGSGEEPASGPDVVRE